MTLLQQRCLLLSILSEIAFRAHAFHLQNKCDKDAFEVSGFRLNRNDVRRENKHDDAQQDEIGNISGKPMLKEFQPMLKEFQDMVYSMLFDEEGNFLYDPRGYTPPRGRHFKVGDIVDYHSRTHNTVMRAQVKQVFRDDATRERYVLVEPGLENSVIHQGALAERMMLVQFNVGDIVDYNSPSQGVEIRCEVKSVLRDNQNNIKGYILVEPGSDQEIKNGALPGRITLVQAAGSAPLHGTSGKRQQDAFHSPVLDQNARFSANDGLPPPSAGRMSSKGFSQAPSLEEVVPPIGSLSSVSKQQELPAELSSDEAFAREKLLTKVIPSGRTVELHSLSAKELNGLQGVVRKYKIQASGDRVEIELPSPYGSKAFKPLNLKFSSSPELFELAEKYAGEREAALTERFPLGNNVELYSLGNELDGVQGRVIGYKIQDSGDSVTVDTPSGPQVIKPTNLRIIRNLNKMDIGASRYDPRDQVQQVQQVENFLPFYNRWTEKYRRAPKTFEEVCFYLGLPLEECDRANAQKRWRKFMLQAHPDQVERHAPDLSSDQKVEILAFTRNCKDVIDSLPKS